MKTLAALLAGFMLAGGLALIWGSYAEPHCPTEDSCSPRYSQGTWTIEEVTP